jgi:tripartite-type tricarboxylate transporter receptor subunit TctC
MRETFALEETTMKRRDLLAAAGATVLSPRLRAQAPDYPKAGATMRYVVPFPPGGLTDVMARQVGQALGERWKVNVVVDNKPGGSGQIGADAVAKAAPDGYNLLAITLTHAVNVTLFPKSPYSLLKDLKPVALLAASAMVVVVPAQSPIKDFADLRARARAGGLNAGSSGNGTPPHLMLALFNQIERTSITHVPYKGGAPSMTDLIGNQLDLVFSNLPESIAHVKSGKLRALVVGSKQRSPLLPEVPTTAELGVPALQMENWTGMMVPVATPDAVVKKLGVEVIALLGAPELAERGRQLGFSIDARGPEPMAAFLNEEVARWGQVVKSASITAD